MYQYKMSKQYQFLKVETILKPECSILNNKKYMAKQNNKSTNTMQYHVTLTKKHQFKLIIDPIKLFLTKAPNAG